MSAVGEPTYQFLAEGGEAGAVMRALDWSQSPLGDPAGWPQSLRTVVGLMINSRHPMFLAWGPALGFLYNDAYISILGAKHPWAMGRPFEGVWPEIWGDIEPLVSRAVSGQPTWSENMHLVMERKGYPEDTWYTFSYSPLHDETGGVAGMFCACTETTSQVLADRAADFRLYLDEQLRGLKEPLDILGAAQRAIGRHLRVARAGYGEIDPAETAVMVHRDWSDREARSLSGLRRALDDFGPEVIAELKAGRTLVVDDVREDPRTSSPGPLAAFADIETRALVVVPLIKAGKFIAILYLHHPEPRLWTASEVALIEQVAERTWAEVERARAQAALNRQAAAETRRLREMFEQAPSFMALLRGPEHVFELANAPFQYLVGSHRLVGRAVRQALPEIARQGFVDLLDQVYLSGEPFVGRAIRILLKQADGSVAERILDFVYQPIRNEAGEVTGIFVDGSDITERFEADERLHIAQRAGRIGAFEWFPDSGAMEVSAEFRRIWGIAEDVPVTSVMLSERIFPEDRGVIGPERLDRANPLEYAEYRIRRFDTDEVRWVARQGEAVLTHAQASRRLVGVVFDITERKATEEALKRLNDHLEQRVAEALAERRLWAEVFEATEVLISVIDQDYDFLAVNTAYADHFQRLYGKRPQAGDNLLALLEGMPEARLVAKKRWEHVFTTDEVFTFVGEVGDPARGSIYYELKHSLLRDRDGRAIGALQFGQDITERVQSEARLRETEEALRQAQKMEAVGQLTGGIAHDFNNLLQGIMGSLDFVQKRIAQGRTDDLDRFISGATASASRAAALTHRLLAFSRRQPLNPKPVQANPLMASMEDLLHRTLGEGVTLTMSLQPDLWLTLSDANQLESAVLNLAINARDAMPGGGRLTIATANVTLGADNTAKLGLPAGDYVQVEVQDTGVGMAPETLERAFDPFYTTKPIGQGTGLGLSMIYGFARQSAGAVQIESELGRGTTVRMVLPRFQGEAAEDEAAPAADLEQGSGEVVLVVEDEAVVRELIIEVLRDLGYRSLQAEDGPSALTVLQSNQRVDLLISDIGLPGLNGRQVADAARKQRPDLKVLLMTGYAENAAAQGVGFLDPGMALMTKPFANDALAKLVGEMLGA